MLAASECPDPIGYGFGLSEPFFRQVEASGTAGQDLSGRRGPAMTDQ